MRKLTFFDMKTCGLCLAPRMAMLLASALVLCDRPALAQPEAGCTLDGYRVVASRWDAVLGMGWELRQDCTHPEWPARSVAVASVGATASVRQQRAAEPVKPLLVHAGETVRLWQRAQNVRIETTGIAEQGARIGELIVVKVTRQTDDSGQSVQRISGTVRGAADVEMER